jgi:hypothetical protein
MKVNSIEELLRNKLKGVLAEAKKRVAASLLEGPMQSAHPAPVKSAKPPMSPDELKAKKKADWNNNVRMPWPKQVDKRAARSAISGFSETEVPNSARPLDKLDIAIKKDYKQSKKGVLKGPKGTLPK